MTPPTNTYKGKCNCLCHFKTKPTPEEYAVSSYYGCKHCRMTNTNKGKKKVKTTEEIYVELYQSWLEAYTVWLALDQFNKQCYPMPKQPLLLDGKIYIQ